MSHHGFKSNIVVAQVIAVMLIGAALRAGGLTTELWFDEICSVRHVQSFNSAWQVLWASHSDNKHHLIWLWMFLSGANQPEWVYRLPSFVSGVVVLPMLYWVIRREFGALAAMIALLLATFCYPLIFYSSEARGYSLAVMFAVFAYALAPDSRRADSVGRAALFSAAVILGFLSHLTFVCVFAGLILWSVTDGGKKPRWMLLAYYIPAMAGLALIYFFDVSSLQYAGGPPTTAIAVLRSAINMSFGVPFNGPWPWLAVITLILIGGVGLAIAGRRYGLPRAVFFLTAIILIPTALTATRRTPFLAVRYYLVCFPFMIMLLSIGCAVIFQSMAGKIIVVAVLTTTAINSLFCTVQLQELGRGHVRDCLLHMANSDTGNPITYRSERMNMDQLNIDYDAASLKLRQRFAPSGASPPDWWIFDLDTPFETGPKVIYRQGATYRLDSVYPSGPISGLTWDLYHRAN